MEKNRTAQYFKYAIGEVILVVIGILIALSINNWNESRKLNLKKQELVSNLIEDFEENNVLLESAIGYNDSLNLKMNSFFENSNSNNLKISLDSLKSLSDGFFRPTTFYPLMTTFDEAKANGNITLLKHKKLSQEFTKFQRNFSMYKDLSDQAVNSFFNGAVWELKKSLGSLGLITGANRGNIRNQLNLEEYMKMIHTPAVTATLENQATLGKNVNNALKRIKTNTENILIFLKELNE